MTEGVGLSARGPAGGRPVLDDRPKLLWVADAPAPSNVRQALNGRWELIPYRRDVSLRQQLGAVSLAVLYADGACTANRIDELVRRLSGSPAVAVVLVPEKDQSAWEAVSRRQGQFVCAAQTAAPCALAATFAAAAALQPAIRDLRSELSAARMIDPAAQGGAVEDLKEEMRLAARLQRDFLPQSLPEVGPVRFGVVFRPASWLSGDIYDIIRLDETHVGFYVADAMGHGMPAALLTMFVKKALQTKQIIGNTYQIVPPEVSLARLNADICDQGLSSCQFCTAVYAVLDTAELTLTFARAGHPEPLLIRPNGSAQRLESRGSLLGVFPQDDIEPRRVQLGPGDRLLAYSDGAEEVLCHNPAGPRRQLEDLAAPWAAVPRDQLLAELTARADARRPGNRYDDDITFILADIEP